MFYTIISDMTGNDKVNGSHATSRSRWHSTASAEPANVEFLWQHWLSALLVCWMTLSSWFTMSCSSWQTPTDWQCARETASISDCTSSGGTHSSNYMLIDWLNCKATIHSLPSLLNWAGWNEYPALYKATFTLLWSVYCCSFLYTAPVIRNSLPIDILLCKCRYD